VALAAAGAIPALVLALVLPGIWYLGLLWICGLLAFLLIDAVAGPSKRALSAELGLPVQAGVGGTVAATVDVKFARQGPRGIEVRIGHDDRLKPHNQPYGAVVLVDGAGRAAFDFTAIRRGTAVATGFCPVLRRICSPIMCRSQLSLSRSVLHLRCRPCC
jgi:uncharacterized protein (DUF58 family)